jgi:hypothetical protein
MENVTDHVPLTVHFVGLPPVHVGLVNMAGMENRVNCLALLGVDQVTVMIRMVIAIVVTLDGTGQSAKNDARTVSAHVTEFLAHVLTVFQDFGVQIVRTNVQEHVKGVINLSGNVCFARTDTGDLTALASVAQIIARGVM